MNNMWDWSSYSFGWEYKPRSSLCRTHIPSCTDLKDPDAHSKTGECRLHEHTPACTKSAIIISLLIVGTQWRRRRHPWRVPATRTHPCMHKKCHNNQPVDCGHSMEEEEECRLHEHTPACTKSAIDSCTDRSLCTTLAGIDQVPQDWWHT